MPDDRLPTLEQWRNTRDLLKRAEDVIGDAVIGDAYIATKYIEAFMADRKAWLEDFRRWEIAELIR